MLKKTTTNPSQVSYRCPSRQVQIKSQMYGNRTESGLGSKLIKKRGREKVKSWIEVNKNKFNSS